MLISNLIYYPEHLTHLPFESLASFLENITEHLIAIELIYNRLTYSFAGSLHQSIYMLSSIEFGHRNLSTVWAPSLSRLNWKFPE
jgi:hypothetical protein